jgi:hypothetical protein
MRAMLAALLGLLFGIIAGTLTTLVFTDCKLREAATLYVSQMREREAPGSPASHTFLTMNAPFWHQWLVPLMCPDRGPHPS